MSSSSRRYTVDEIAQYLDDNFNIPDDGVNSDFEEKSDEEEFEDFEDNQGTLQSQAQSFLPKFLTRQNKRT